MWSVVAPSGIYRCTASTGHSYSLTNGGSIFRFEVANQLWSEIEFPTPEPIVAISANGESLIAQTYEGKAYTYEFGMWTLFPALDRVKSCSSGGINSAVVVEGTSINKYTNGVYQSLSVWGGPTKVSATQGCAHIWGVDDDKNVFRWNSGSISWEQIYGAALIQVDVSLSASGDEQVYGVDAVGRGWKYNGTGWIQMPNIAFGVKYAWLEVRSDYLWAVSTTGVAYHKILA